MSRVAKFILAAAVVSALAYIGFGLAALAVYRYFAQ